MTGAQIKMKAVVFGMAVAVAAPAHADGFAVRDFTEMTDSVAGFFGGRWETRVEPDRLTMMCFGCDDAPVLDFQLGRQSDGTEDRVRSGQTTFAELEEICRAKTPDCRIEGLDVVPAVGWMSTFRVGSKAAHTIVVLRDGDMLYLRSISENADVARKNADAAIANVVPLIVGD
jgi:hypothetical protein